MSTVKKSSDFIIYERAKTEAARGAGSANTGQARPLTEGLWQKEALETLNMHSATEGNFTPVKGGEQLTLFDMGPITQTKKIDLDSPSIDLPHWDSFRFLGKDTLQQVRTAPSRIPNAPPSHATDAVSATGGELLKDGVTGIKEDHFPDRIQYTKGGLYPENNKEAHADAPNYRKMGNRRIHGVGQPTEKGFRDVLNHLRGKDKPVVWTNTRAEAVIYINGKPHNLRELASSENLVLREGATGEEVEALENELKRRIIERGSIRIAKEVPGQREPIYEDTPVNADNVKTTKDVVDDLRAEGYKIEYKRIPLADEKPPTPAQMDEIRRWTKETQDKYPNEELDYVFNCHQGRGRTTTGMVASAITQDGQTAQLKLPLIGVVHLGENAEERAKRIINDAEHMQNLHKTIEETKKKAQEAKTPEERKKYEARAVDFTKRYALMQKYSEYIDKYGAGATTPTFEEWMSQTAQTKDLNNLWAALNKKLGVPGGPQLPPGHSDVAYA